MAGGELFPYSDVDLSAASTREPEHAIAQGTVSEIFARALGSRAARQPFGSHRCRMLPLQEPKIRAAYQPARRSLSVRRAPRCSSATFPKGGPDSIERHADAAARAGRTRPRRHAKFNNTVYHLEPNIKEGPGGIRDIHLSAGLSRLAPDKEPQRIRRRGVERGHEISIRGSAVFCI